MRRLPLRGDNNKHELQNYVIQFLHIKLYTLNNKDNNNNFSIAEVIPLSVLYVTS